jgi:hypothetical protein
MLWMLFAPVAVRIDIEDLPVHEAAIGGAGLQIGRAFAAASVRDTVVDDVDAAYEDGRGSGSHWQSPS